MDPADAPEAVVAMPAPGPMLVAPYAHSIHAHFKWVTIGAAVLHLALLVLLAGKRTSGFVAAILTVCYFLLFLNLLVMARVGWRLFSARTRTTTFVLLVSALASLLVWLLADVAESLPRLLAYVSAALAAFAWLGVLGLLRSVIDNADGNIEDAFRRSGAATVTHPAALSQHHRQRTESSEPPAVALNLHAPNIGQVLSKIPTAFSSPSPMAGSPTAGAPVVYLAQPPQVQLSAQQPLQVQLPTQPSVGVSVVQQPTQPLVQQQAPPVPQLPPPQPGSSLPAVPVVAASAAPAPAPAPPSPVTEFMSRWFGGGGANKARPVP